MSLCLRRMRVSCALLFLQSSFLSLSQDCRKGGYLACHDVSPHSKVLSPDGMSRLQMASGMLRAGMFFAISVRHLAYHASRQIAQRNGVDLELADVKRQKKRSMQDAKPSLALLPFKSRLIMVSSPCLSVRSPLSLKLFLPPSDGLW